MLLSTVYIKSKLRTMNNSTNDFRLLSAETICLESEDYDRATQISDRMKEEKQSWQTYLNLLALFGLETWLKERLPNKTIANKIDVAKETYYLQVGDFTVQAIATENLLDEVVTISSERVREKATHFYVLLEVIEENEEAIFRGLLRHDRLTDYLHTSDHRLPLSLFDSEPNHLLFYCQYLEPDAIALPVIETKLTPVLSTQRTKLTQWLQETIIEGWETLDKLINPEASLAFSTRSVTKEYKRGKVINLGMELNQVTMMLLVTVTEQEEGKLKIGMQLYPTNQAKYLPPEVQLTLISKAGKTLQSVQAREQDSFIQLKPFKGKPGKRFTVEIALGETQIREDFEL